MQAAPLSVLKALAISGNEDKLAIAFTHFDQIRGQNLAGMSDRRAHVMASVISALSSLKDAVGARIIQSLEVGIDDRCFMLGGTQKKLSTLKPNALAYMTEQLENLMQFCIAAAEPKGAATAELLYGPLGISFAVQNGSEQFNRIWRARLGLTLSASVRKEHWTRIKALNKRIAGEMGLEYDTLRPVADLHTSILGAISRYLDKPFKEPEVDEEQRATTRARRLVAGPLLKLLRERLVDRELGEWRVAFELRGPGSAYKRAVAIAAIDERASPIPGAVMPKEAHQFLKEISEIVVAAVRAVGGNVEVV